MTRNKIQKIVACTVFGLGILGGIWCWWLYLRAMFVVGQNDCPQEVWAITFALATPLPACVIALWRRIIAGLWLVFAGLFFPYGMIAQRTYMIQVRHFPDPRSIMQTVAQGLVIVSPVLAVGLFAVITGILKWPNLLGKPQASLPQES